MDVGHLDAELLPQCVAREFTGGARNRDIETASARFCMSRQILDGGAWQLGIGGYHHASSRQLRDGNEIIDRIVGQ